MKRLLPPLVVLLILAVVVWRVAKDPRHDRDRAWIKAHWHAQQADEVREVTGALERYLEEYGTLEERRWFAARAYFELGLAPHAIDAVWQVPELAAKPDTARRLMDLYLRTTGFHELENLDRLDPGADRILQVLTDAGDAEAAERLVEMVRGAPLNQYRPLYFAALTQGLRTSHDLLLGSLRLETTGDARLAAAVLAMPPSAEELEALRATLPDDGHRKRERLFWGLAAHMLARYGSADDVEAVRKRAEALRAASDPETRTDALVAASGLLAAGQWDLIPWFVPALSSPRSDPVKDWYLEGLLHRAAQGDEEALGHIEDLWTRTRTSPELGIRPRTLVSLYLRNDLPPEDAATERLLERIRGDAQADPADRMLLDAIRLRRGDRNANADLLRFVRDVGRTQTLQTDPGLLQPMVFSPLLQAARAILLFDR